MGFFRFSKKQITMKKRRKEPALVSTEPQEIKFKKVGENLFIDNIIDYIVEKVSYDPGTPPVIVDNKLVQPGNPSNIVVSIGCDSSDIGRLVEYVITIVFYNDWKKNGAHIVYKRLRMPKTMVIQGKKSSQWVKEYIDPEFYKKVPTNIHSLVYNRLMNEGYYLMELGKYLNEGLQGKYYIEHSKNDYDGSTPYCLPVVHVDYNPVEGEGRQNKSNDAYHSFMGELCGEGFKVLSKPFAYASTTAADFLLSK